MSNNLSPLRQLLHLIERENHQPGDRLPTERKLAERFGCSRVSIRGALNRLDALHVIELRARSGIYLHHDPLQCSVEVLALMEEAELPINRQMVSHAVELRSLLEIEAIRLACQRRNPIDLGRIHQVISRSQEELIKGGNLISLDPKFHLAMIAAAHNPLLTHFAASFYRMSLRRREFFFSGSKRNQRSQRQHIRLYEAVEDRDEALAVQLLEQHLMGVGRYFESWYQTVETTTQ